MMTAATDSDSILDKVTNACFLELQEIKLLNNLNQEPLTGFLSKT